MRAAQRVGIRQNGLVIPSGFSDNFNRSDQTLVGAAPYDATTYNRGIGISGNKVVCTDDTLHPVGIYYDIGQNIPAYAQADIVVPASTGPLNNIGVEVASSGAGSAYYFTFFGGTLFGLFTTDGSYFYNSPGSHLNSTMVMGLYIDAAKNLTCYLDGVSVITHAETSATLMGTHCGARINIGSPSDIAIDNFHAQTTDGLGVLT